MTPRASPMSERHRHYWHHPHTVWQGHEGRKDVAVARYCACGAVEMAYSGPWKPVPRSHPDVKRHCFEERVKP